MTSPWLADPNGGARGAVRTLVRDSWRRSTQSQLDPERLLSPLRFETSELHEYRQQHPLASVMPVIRKLLVHDADDDSGMLVAVGDAMGRLLWVEGDTDLKSRAESMMFVEGSDWSETVAGTSAPGTALALDHAIQIRRDEHFNQLVHSWSCTAVPVHDPETRSLIGVIDITGGDKAVDRHTMPLMQATAHAVETELALQRLRESRSPGAADARAGSSRFVMFDRMPTAARAQPPHASLDILNRDTGLLRVGATTLELSPRHAEIVTLLAWHGSGLSAERLAELLTGDSGSTARLRAEMVRLRKLLAGVHAGLAPQSKPYRLPEPLETDAHHVVALLDRGAHRAALAAYRGPLLPDSTAPGIEEIRREVLAHLRESILTSASVEVLFEFAQSPAGVHDPEVWTALVRLLPARSPKRAGVVAHLEALEAREALAG
jgi:hypothetical protein